jgi:hypothetical protein
MNDRNFIMNDGDFIIDNRRHRKKKNHL